MADTLRQTIAAVHAYLTQHRTPDALPEVSADSCFERDLRCDPIDMVCIEIEVGDALGIEFPGEPLANCETVGDLAQLAARLRAGEAV